MNKVLDDQRAVHRLARAGLLPVIIVKPETPMEGLERLFSKCVGLETLHIKDFGATYDLLDILSKNEGSVATLENLCLGGANVSNKVLKLLPRFPALKYLKLSDRCRLLNNNSIRILCRCKNLESLNLAGHKTLDDRMLTHLLPPSESTTTSTESKEGEMMVMTMMPLPKLTALNIAFTLVTPEGVQQFVKRRPNFEQFTEFLFIGLVPGDWDLVARIVSERGHSLQRVFDAAAFPLDDPSTLGRIVDAGFYVHPAKPEVIHNLKYCTSLESIAVHNGDFGDDQPLKPDDVETLLSTLAKLPALRVLSLQALTQILGNLVPRSSIGIDVAFEHLRKLKLKTMEVQCEVLLDISKLKHLRELDLAWCTLCGPDDDVQNALLEIFAHCTELRSVLGLWTTGELSIVHPKLRRLQATRLTIKEIDCPNLQYYDFGESVEKNGANGLIRAPLRKLVGSPSKLGPILASDSSDTLRALEFFATSQGIVDPTNWHRASGLRKLKISGNCELQNMSALSNMKHLHRICLSDCKLASGNGLNSSSVRVLELDGVNSIKELDLSGVPNLQKLTLKECDELTQVIIEDKPWLDEVTIWRSHNIEKITLKNVGGRTTLELNYLNKLQQIELINCTKLWRASIVELIQLRSIDLQRCPELTHLELRGLVRFEDQDFIPNIVANHPKLQVLYVKRLKGGIETKEQLEALIANHRKLRNVQFQAIDAIGVAWEQLRLRDE